MTTSAVKNARKFNSLKKPYEVHVSEKQLTGV